MENNQNIQIIDQAYSLIKDHYAFSRSTKYLNYTTWDGLSEEDYSKIEYKTKAIRQDYSKILVIMNCIDRTYKQYQRNEYVASYSYVINNQATSELGCFIEYLFAKYRVVLEYIQQIMEICIPTRFNDEKKEVYQKLKKAHTKFKYLIDYVADNVGKTSNILNMEWFQSVRVDRDYIIHDGATCLVFDDKNDLLYKVMTTDALDKEENKPNAFYSNEKGLIHYNKYWGLQISKLIIFVETMLEYLISIGNISDDNRKLVDSLSQGRNKLIDSDGRELSDSQDVLCEMLKALISMESQS